MMKKLCFLSLILCVCISTSTYADTDVDTVSDPESEIHLMSTSDDYTKTMIGSNQTYKSGSIKIIVTDDVSGQKTTGILTVFRDSAPKWDTMTTSATTWDCKLTIDGTNHHNLSLAQTTVTTKKDAVNNYQVMNFKLNMTQHAYYIYDDQIHAGAGNGFRLNFESYAQDVTGPGTIIDGIVEKDTVRSINWQLNTAAIGLRTYKEVKYTNCKSWLNYERPSHTITVKPNGGTYAGKNTNTDYKKLTGEWLNLTDVPSRNYYFFSGFQCLGDTYVYRAAATGTSTDMSSGFSSKYIEDGDYTKYTCSSPKKSDTYYVRMNRFFVPKNHKIRITGQIRINSLPKSNMVQIYEKTKESDPVEASASLSGADGEWKTFDISRTYKNQADEALIEFSVSNCRKAIQFDLKNIVITDVTANKRLGDANLQISSNVTLTAQWTPLKYQIQYDAGESNATGSMDAQIQNQDQTLSLCSNQFQLKNATFAGWKYKNTIYPAGEIISYDDLVQTPLQKRKADADINPNKIEAEDTFSMTAVWDHAPVINLTNEPVTYIEGESIKTNQLLDLVESCTDPEDGDLTGKVSLKEIRYQASKTGYQPKKQTSFTSKSVLDTYFQHLQKEESVTATAVYMVTDSIGNTTTAEQQITILYNYPPKITARNLSYYQQEIKSDAKKVRQEILQNAAASDLEDDNWKRKLSIIVKSPDPLDVSKMESLGTYHVIYSVTDSLGKESTAAIQIYVAAPDFYPARYHQSVRFISKDYVDTLSNNSIWKKNSEYYQFLMQSLNTTGDSSGNTYTITTGN